MTDNHDDVEYRVTAEGVKKAFGDNKVLKGVSFTVERGTATAIIGPSGSGKTTLLRTLNALDRADAGVIRVDDVEIDFSTPTPKPRCAGSKRAAASCSRGTTCFRTRRCCRTSSRVR